MRLNSIIIYLFIFTCVVSVVCANPGFGTVHTELRQNPDNASEYTVVNINDQSEYPSVATVPLQYVPTPTPVVMMVPVTQPEIMSPTNLTNTMIAMPFTTPWLTPIMLALLLVMFGMVRGRSAVFLALIGYGLMYFLGWIPAEFTWMGTALLTVGIAVMIWGWLIDSPRRDSYDYSDYTPSSPRTVPEPRVEPAQQDARRELDSILDNPAQLTNTDVPMAPEPVSTQPQQDMTPPKSRWEQLE